MTASEFAFLALGLVLGFASGAAIVVVLGSRPPAREIRLTVGHDAVPRRAATLSADAFVAHGEPARGGPADRRLSDRDDPADDPPAPGRGGFGVTFGRPVMTPAPAFATAAGGPAIVPEIRTSVPSLPPQRASMVARPAGSGERAARAAIPIVPESDVAGLPTDAADDPPEPVPARGAAAEATVRMPTTAILDAPAAPAGPPPSGGLDLGGPSDHLVETPVESVPVLDPTPAILRILRGDLRALLRTVEVLAGADAAMRRPWQAAVTGLAEAVIHRSITDGILDFPVGNPFWDTFTTPQCRQIARALAATGHRFDGIGGWDDERAPSYRELTAAVAGAGMEPRRIRAWPTPDQIATLYGEVTVAADEYLAVYAPDLEFNAVQAIAGLGDPALEVLWQHWAMARPVLLGPVPPT